MVDTYLLLTCYNMARQRLEAKMQFSFLFSQVGFEGVSVTQRHGDKL